MNKLDNVISFDLLLQADNELKIIQQEIIEWLIF